jgi:hypothetical protein
MARKTYKRYSKKGGFLNVNESLSNLEQKFSDFGSKISQGTSDLWRKTKEAVGMNGSNMSSSYAPTTSYPSSTYGGRRSRRSRRVKRGGSSTNTAPDMANKPIQTTMASATNKPIQTLTSKVGGRRRSRSRRSSRRRSRR